MVVCYFYWIFHLLSSVFPLFHTFGRMSNLDVWLACLGMLVDEERFSKRFLRHTENSHDHHIVCQLKLTINEFPLLHFTDETDRIIRLSVKPTLGNQEKICFSSADDNAWYTATNSGHKYFHTQTASALCQYEEKMTASDLLRLYWNWLQIERDQLLSREKRKYCFADSFFAIDKFHLLFYFICLFLFAVYV